MTQVTVKELAQVVDTPVERLLLQMRDAGLPHTSAEQVVTDSEKQALLTHLKGSHGDRASEPRKITLQRKTTTTLKVGGSKTVSVEVRKKKTYVKRSPDEIEAERQRELEEQRAAEEAERLKAEEAAARQRAEEEARKAEEAARAKAAQEAAATAGAEPAVVADVAVAEPVAKPAAVEERKKEEPRRVPKRDEDDDRRDRKHTQHRPSVKEKEKVPAPRVAPRSTDEESDGYRRGGRGGKSKLKKRNQHGFQNPTGPIVREVNIGETITVAELAAQMSVKGAEVVKFMFKMGSPVTINQVLDQETAQLVAEELGHKVKLVSENALEEQLAESLKFEGEAVTRAPVVTVMGHVDHGKTSLLDYIRRTKVATGEAGGITQHIGAYHVDTPKGVISFLDTPGHAAFTSMRARGAKLTDIVVLVVAADDGVMPQTKEAIQHARSAGVPLIVAINKIDKSDADPMRVKNELLSEQVVAEDFGGDTQMVEISAKTGLGIDDLLDAISIQAELLELKAVDEGRASGVVIESSLDKGRGPVATVLVQQGRLKKGDYLVCGIQYGRVRALFDETGKQPEFAGPSIPVQVLGLSGVPEAGDDFVVVEDERLAKDVAQQRETKRRESRLVATAGSRMEDIMATLGKGEGQQVLNLVIKADVQGSVQALSQALVALSNEDIRINVIHSGVGGITESDANSAAASKATVIGFNVRADASARRIIESNGVDLRYFSIIYDVIDQVKQVASGLLGVEIREEIIGIAEVRDVFRSSKLGAVAGSMVIEGVVRRNKPIRVLRDSVVIFEGELESLRRFKENVEEVRNGTECGIAVKAYNDVKPGDQIECFERIEVPRTL